MELEPAVPVLAVPYRSGSTNTGFPYGGDHLAGASMSWTSWCPILRFMAATTRVTVVRGRSRATHVPTRWSLWPGYEATLPRAKSSSVLAATVSGLSVTLGSMTAVVLSKKPVSVAPGWAPMTRTPVPRTSSASASVKKIGIWALAHGLSLLLLDGRLGNPAPDEIDALVDGVLRTMVNAEWRSGTTAS